MLAANALFDFGLEMPSLLFIEGSAEWSKLTS